VEGVRGERMNVEIIDLFSA